MKRFLFLSIVWAACSPPPPVATEADAVRAHVELAALQQGRELLIQRCGGCHDVPVPKKRHREDWPKQVAEMAPKAGIDDAQRALIEQYLVTMAPR